MQPTISLPQDVSLAEKDSKAVAGKTKNRFLHLNFFCNVLFY